MAGETLNILIGGEAGQGLATVGELLTKALAMCGYRLVVTQSYHSRIRGGHNTFAIRTGPGEVLAPVDEVDVLVALNQETLDLHTGELVEGGLVLMAARLKTDLDASCALTMPMKELAPKPIFENVAALGALASVIGIGQDVVEGLVADTFKKKGEEVIRQNREVLAKAYAWAAGQGRCGIQPLPPVQGPRPGLLLNGSEAVALGALAAGVGFCAFYPMTPSTSIALTLIAKAGEMQILVEQAEDEIAALNMALGASFAGAKSMVTTSGGGFALMVEALSLAGMIEQPVVIALGMRPAPATGLPTRTGQEDLNFVIHAGHGEFPRAVFAPGSVEDLFHLTHRAFDQAEKWQSPAFVLTDQYFADTFRIIAPIDLDALPAAAGPDRSDENPEGYQRFALTASGVSPRRLPGLGRSLVVADSDEHTPDGHITEDLGVRKQMVEKRLKKGCGLLADVLPPVFAGDEEPELLLVCWGSTYGAVLEAVGRLRADGKMAACLHFPQVWPLKKEQFLTRLESTAEVVCVEGNATGQLAGLIRRETGFAVHRLVLRYDGLPFTARYILEHLENGGPAVVCAQRGEHD
jgi:2-oxoglutarate ferredoxin oxidoreductase subunit alpha